MINIIFPFDPRHGGGKTYDPAEARLLVFDVKRKLRPLFDAKWPEWDWSAEPTANVMSSYSKTLGRLIRMQVIDPL